MNFVERIVQELRKLSGASTSTAIQPNIREKLELANTLKRNGDYAASLSALDAAEALIKPNTPNHIITLVALRRVEILIRQGNWSQVEDVLLTLKQQTNNPNTKENEVFVLLTEGNVAQHQGKWEIARERYTKAMKIARENGITNLAGRAAGYLADVYAHEDNLSYAIYLLEDALERLNKSGDLELSSYFVGRLGEAQISMGERAQGQQLLGRALRLAEHLNDKTYELKWRGSLAVQAIIDDQYEDAKRHLLIILSELDRDLHFEDYVYSLCRMSKVSLRLNDSKTALDYAQQAHELTDGSEHRTLHALAQACLGITLRNMSDHKEALQNLSDITDIYAELKLTQADYSMVDVLRNLAAAQSDVGDHETAQLTYENALEFAEAQDNALAKAGTYSDLGILYTRQHQYSDAINVWTDAIQIYEQHGCHARVARLYCDVANLRKQTGSSHRALKDYEKALMLLNSFDDPDTRGIVLSNAATAYVDQGDIETAESFFVEAIKIAIKLQDRLAEATRRGNYGWFLISTGRAQRAISTLTYALQQSENLGLTLQTAVQRDNLGLAHDETGNFDEAIQFHRQALEDISNSQVDYWQATIKANLAHSLISTESFDEASILLDSALQIGKETANNELIVRAMNGQSRIKLAQNNTNVQDHFDEAVKIAERASLRRLLADAYALRSQYHSEHGAAELSIQDWQAAQNLFEILNLKREAYWLDSISQPE